MELFKQLARAIQDGLDAASDGSLALDKLVPIHLANRRVTRHLAARQTSGGGEPRLPNKRGGDNNPEVERLREKNQKVRKGVCLFPLKRNTWIWHLTCKVATRTKRTILH